MGKGGRGKSGARGTGASKTTDDDDEKLLDAIIAENELAKQALAAQHAASELGGSTTWWGGDGEPPKMTSDQIVEKLNRVPCFCLLNGESALLGLKDLADESGQRSICTWFTDPSQAKDMLAQCKAHSPELAAGLHLGVTPLGVAYAFACGWAELDFDGDKQVHGSAEPDSSSSEAMETLHRQAKAAGLDSKRWHVPVFTCMELATPARMPFFLSRKALAESWLMSGRKLSALSSNVAMLDLGVVVHEMMTGAASGHHAQFICERKAISLVDESVQACGPEQPPELEQERDQAVAAIQQALLAAAIGGQGGGPTAAPADSAAAPEARQEAEQGRAEEPGWESVAQTGS